MKALAFVLGATLALVACEKPKALTAGQEVAGLIDPNAVCTAHRDDSSVCRVQGLIMLCSRDGCQAIKFSPPPAEVAAKP